MSEHVWRRISGMSVVAVLLAALFGFHQIAPLLTFTLASIGLVGLVLFFWVAGKTD